MASADEERLATLRLIRTPTIGPITFFRLIERYGGAEEALRALPDLSRGAGRARPLAPISRAQAEAELARADQLGARVIAYRDDDYPRLLAKIDDPPPILFTRGHASLAARPVIAMVGSRNASSAGRAVARALARDLGAANVAIASGLARGIDGAAHEASLASGAIAVVAGGIDVIYPPEHDRLTEAIAERGLLISEAPPGHQPTARDFPRRNRLISGIARGVVIVEAALRSGTLITARFALEQGREVFAVPGSPLDPRCRGANKLIKDGATLVEDADDILATMRADAFDERDGDGDLFGWARARDVGTDAASPGDLRGARERVREALSMAPTHRDQLMRDCALAPGLFADALLDLVLSEEAIETPGGAFALHPERS